MLRIAKCYRMNGVTNGRAYLYLLVAEYRMGLEVDGGSSYFIFRLNIPQLFSSLFELGSFYFYSLHFVQRSNEVQGENWREQTSQSCCQGMCFQGAFCCLCLLLLFPLLMSALFSDSDLLQCIDCFSKTHCPFVWVLWITPSQVPCLTLLTAAFPPFPLPAHFSNFQGDFQY